MQEVMDEHVNEYYKFIFKDIFNIKIDDETIRMYSTKCMSVPNYIVY